VVGSLHLLTADAYPLPPALDAAFANADVWWRRPIPRS
jgi:uncharacterized protein YbaP (TraB family)